MKIGIYSDIHSSRNDAEISETNIHNIHSSVLWAREEFKKQGCELIVNTGDFFDSDTIDAETNYMVSDIYKKHGKMKEIIVCGNHEIKDAEGKYNSLCMLDNYPNVTIINNLDTMKIGDITFIFQPYTKDINKMKELQAALQSIKGKKVLFSHLTYINVPNIRLNENIKGEIDYNWIKDDVDLIFNGHIHIGLESDKYYQVGTITGFTFNDDYTFHKPGIIIFDTDTLEVKRIENPLSILYEKTVYNKLKVKFPERTCLRVDCPAGKALDIEKKLAEMKLLSYKIRIMAEDTKDSEVTIKKDFNTYTNPASALYDFIKIEKGAFTEEELKSFIKDYIEESKQEVK